MVVGEAVREEWAFGLVEREEVRKIEVDVVVVLPDQMVTLTNIDVVVMTAIDRAGT